MTLREVLEKLSDYPDFLLDYPFVVKIGDECYGNYYTPQELWFAGRLDSVLEKNAPFFCEADILVPE
jgi:hypothetical protein